MEDKISESDAAKLIEALKRLVDEGVIVFPSPGGYKEIIAETLLGETTQFVISIAPGARDLKKCTYQVRTKNTNIVLLRLDLVPEIKSHKNPDKTVIYGPHLHIYSEKYGDGYAVKFDAGDKDLINNCLVFFRKLNVVDPSPIQIEMTLFN